MLSTIFLYCVCKYILNTYLRVQWNQESPSQNEQLTPFENNLYDMVPNIEFKTGQNDFQKTLMSVLKKIQSSKNVVVLTDKTADLYEMSPDQYNSLLKNIITKTYRKTELITKTWTDKETRKLSKPLKLDNKMECYAERHAFITLKDHKENFKQITKCRLINTAKGVSRMYLAQIIKDANNIIKFNQWKKLSLSLNGSRISPTKTTADLSNLISRKFILQFLRNF